MRIILSALWGWNLGLALCFVLLAIGCSRTESITPVIPTITPIPTPVPTLLPTPILAPTQVVIVNERADVMESLILLNDTNINFVSFMQGNGEIYSLVGENKYHVAYVASKQILFGLLVYENAIVNWTPPNNSYYDKLMEMKEAELYRIHHFREISEMMVDTLPTENDGALEVVRQQFYEWKDDPRNKKPMRLQNEVLIELNISPDDVNFMYIIPVKELDEVTSEENLGDSLIPDIQKLPDGTM